MHFRQPGMQVTYAKIDPSNFSMLHFLQDDGMFFEKNQYGIPEPIGGITINEKDIDIVFIPLLAFDRSGNRVAAQPFVKPTYEETKGQILDNLKAEITKEFKKAGKAAEAPAFLS
jgi:hypothetical protein